MRNFLSIQKVFSFSLTFFLATFLALLAGCGPGTGGTSGTGTTLGTGTVTVQLYDATGAVATSVSPGANVTVKATVLDGTGAAAPNTVVTFSVTDTKLATVNPATALTDSQGIAQVTLSATGNGVGATSITASATVTGATGPATASGVTPTGPVTASGQASFAVTSGATSGTPSLTMQLTNSNGAAITQISPSVPGTVAVTVKDGSGAALPNVIVTFSVLNTSLAAIVNNSNQPVITALTGSNGVATVTLTALAPGATSVTATATVNGTPLNGLITFSVITNSASLTLSLTSTTVVAGGPTVYAIANFLDETGKPKSGVNVTFTVANPALATVTASAATDISGNAQATLTAIGTGTTSVTAVATDPSSNSLITSNPVSFTVGTPIASLSLSATPTTVKSDNSTSATVTVTALSVANAATPGVVVSLSTNTGILSANSVTTDNTGKATFTFSSGTASKSNRTATITASAGVTAALPVQIVGSTLTVNATGASVPVDGTSPVTMTFSAKDAGGNPISGAAVTLTKPAGVTLTPSSGTTDANGQLVVSVTGGAGFTCLSNCVVTASAVGATASAPITVTTVSATFGISQTILNGGTPITSPTGVAMQIGDSLVVLVTAPAPTTSVTFATTMGSWNGLGTTLSVSVDNGVIHSTCGTITTIAGQACATLTTATAGLANVQVFDTANPTTSDSLTVSMTATTPYKITLQASPSVVSKCVGTTCSYATLIATVTDVNNLPVGNAQVVFSIVNPTGGGESVSPVVQPTAAVATSTLALGQARTQFTAGSLSSTGVHIRAQVLGYPLVVTNTSPSGSDATIVIGGAAASMAFGQATSVGVTPDGTAYTLNMTVLVTDSNGSPVPAGTVVNLNAWPIAWSTGQSCIVDADNGSSKGTFDNEDANENLFLDPGEDGGPGVTTITNPSPPPPNLQVPARIYYYTGNQATAPGTQDGQLTPPSAAAGSVPGTITTDANLPSGAQPTGLAAFTLTYPKTSAIWTVTRIRAQTLVSGSAAVSQVIFPLPALLSDVAPICKLGNSPYIY
ncbi:MAG: Ig-like domain-containing protein [Gallionellaceae bacterium]